MRTEPGEVLPWFTSPSIWGLEPILAFRWQMGQVPSYERGRLTTICFGAEGGEAESTVWAKQVV